MTDILALGWKLFGLRGDLLRAKDLSEPTYRELEKVLPELLAIGNRVQQELFPHTVKNSVVASFDVFWVQSALNKLGEKLKVDGDLGPVTQKAVRDFQTKNLIVPDDGFPGRATCVAIWNKLEK